jgi:hypothetical protein
MSSVCAIRSNLPYTEDMPVSMEFLRGVLGLIGIGAAYMTGRSIIAVRRGWQKPPRLYAWILRSAVCLAVVGFRNPLDRTDIVVWSLALVSLLAGVWQTSREKAEEDLTHTMFPEDGHESGKS